MTVSQGFFVIIVCNDPNDKEYQKLLIDNLVYKVFVYDDHIITYLTFGNDKEIKEISLADNDKAIDELKVQPLSSLVQVVGLERVDTKTQTPLTAKITSLKH